MANKIQKFFSETFGTVRARYIDGECWFVGKDIALALGYKDTKSALIDHVDDDLKRTLNTKIIQQMASRRKGGETPPLEMSPPDAPDTTSPRGLLYIKEAGLYQLIFSSKLPKAVEFQRWIFETVLPKLRRDGIYNALQDDARALGKTTRRTLTDTIKIFCEYLKTRGELDRQESAWYIIFTNLVNKTLGFDGERDDLSALQLLHLQDCEQIAARELDEAMASGKGHHDCYEACRIKLE